MTILQIIADTWVLFGYIFTCLKDILAGVIAPISYFSTLVYSTITGIFQDPVVPESVVDLSYFEELLEMIPILNTLLFVFGALIGLGVIISILKTLQKI